MRADSFGGQLLIALARDVQIKAESKTSKNEFLIELLKAFARRPRVSSGARKSLVKKDLNHYETDVAPKLRSTLWERAEILEAIHGGYSFARINLRGAQLEGADLQRVDLSEAILYEANLSRVNLDYAKLTKANLGRAILHGAKMRNSDLHFTYMSAAEMGECQLHYANMQGVNLNLANLREANLYGANLEGSKLASANLTDANLEGVNLSGSYLGGAKLLGANFTYTNMAETSLEGAFWSLATRWPPELIESVRQRSYEISPGLFIFGPDNFANDRAERVPVGV